MRARACGGRAYPLEGLRPKEEGLRQEALRPKHIPYKNYRRRRACLSLEEFP